MFATREKISISVDGALCTRCGACERVCPSAVFSWVGDAPVAGNPGRCIGCGHCVASCPTGAFAHSELDATRFCDIADGPRPGPEVLSRAFAERRSCRRFRDEALNSGEIETVLGFGALAPTSTNSQNVRFAVFAGGDRVRVLTELTSRYYLKLGRQLSNPFVRLAISLTVGRKTVSAYRLRMPAIVEMFSATLDGRGDRLFYGAPAVAVLFASGLPHLACASCNLAAMQILLGAESMGLGACYNGYALTAMVRDRKVREAVGIEKGYTPGAVIALGKPAGGFHRIPPRNRSRIIWT